jgi:hypothetical protein
MLYFYLLLGQQYVTAPINNEIPYKPHTTNVVITNRDMYDLNEIIDMTFKEE